MTSIPELYTIKRTLEDILNVLRKIERKLPERQDRV